MNLRLKFSMAENDLSTDHRIIIVNIDGKNIGFLIDSVLEVPQVDSDNISDLPREIFNTDSRYITKVVKYNDKIFIILDVDEITGGEEISQVLGS